MSDTYIGPFGHILPVEYRPSSPPQADRQNLPARRSAAAMTTALPPSAPRLPLPAGLQFGTDPRPSYSDPHRWETTRHDHRPSASAPRPGSRHEKLPSVSQLLTPTSQGSPTLPNSGPPFPREYRAGPSSPQGSTHSDSYARSEASHVSYGSSDYTYSRPPVPHNPPAYADGPSSRPAPIQSPYTPTSDVRYGPHSSYSLPHHSVGHYAAAQYDKSGYSDQQLQRAELRTVTQPAKKLIGEENVPGEGPCYIYEDGTRVRKVIDGEAVNANWGITKAGKPRKRLAIACVTCREKKIKCEPAEPKCVQCEKSGRECRFQTAVRNQMREGSSTSYEQQANTQTTLRRQTNVEATEQDRDPTPVATSPTSLAELPERYNKKRETSCSRDSAADHLKRLKHDYEESQEMTFLYPSLKIRTERHVKQEDPIIGATFDHITDPYLSHPKSTLHYVDRYMKHFNAGRYSMFPAAYFGKWVIKDRDKKLEDLIVLFSVMAVGSMFSEREDAKSVGQVFYKLAIEEVEKSIGEFNIQAIQSRLVLGFYCFGNATFSVGWEMSGTAMRMAMALRMHIETLDKGGDVEEGTPFQLPRSVLEECYRRTFWVCFIFDRFQAFCLEHVLVMQKDDIFLRLPCNDVSYENNRIKAMPYFDNGVIDQSLVLDATSASSVSPLSFLLSIMALAGEVQQQAHRLANTSAQTYASAYESYHHSMTVRIHTWQQSLPHHFQAGPVGLHASIEGDYADVFSSAHAMYHLALVMLNSRIRRPLLSPSAQRRNATTALAESAHVLELVDVLTELHGPGEVELEQPPAISWAATRARALMAPFLGHAIFYAADILSAAGSASEQSIRRLCGRLEVARRLSDKLVSLFPIVRFQCRALRKRIAALEKLVDDDPRPLEGPPRAWRFSRPMQTNRESEMPLFYADKGGLVLEILGLPGLSEEEVVEL